MTYDDTSFIQEKIEKTLETHNLVTSQDYKTFDILTFLSPDKSVPTSFLPYHLTIIDKKYVLLKCMFSFEGL